MQVQKYLHDRIPNWFPYSKHIKAIWPKDEEDRQRYLNRLKLGYWHKTELDQDFWLTFRSFKTGEIRTVQPSASARFSKKYRDRTYYKLYWLSKLNAVGFLTLTVPCPDNMTSLQYQDAIQSFSKKWQQLRSYAWRYNIKFDYFRVFEVTKRGMLHAHIILFSESYKISTYEMEVLAQYWHRKNGFVKLYKWSLAGDYEYCHEFRINETGTDWIFRPERSMKKTENRSALNYTMKYQLKEANELTKAVMTKYRIRSYSYSQSLKIFIRQIVSTQDWQLIGKGQVEPNEMPIEKKLDPSHFLTAIKLQKYEKNGHPCHRALKRIKSRAYRRSLNRFNFNVLYYNTSRPKFSQLKHVYDRFSPIQRYDFY